jgi:capsular polysaccharide biosynthesis protein
VTAGTQGRRTPKARNGTVAGRAATPRTDAPAGGPTAGPADGTLWDGGRPRSRRSLTQREWVRLGAFAVVLVLFGALAGWVTSLLLPKQYAAHAEVLYAISQEQPTGFLREDRNITTQIVLLNSRSVLDPVAKEWGISVQELSGRISAEVVSGSEVITITLTDREPDRAQDMLDWLVQQYLQVSNNDPRAELRNYLDTQLTDVLTRISEVRADADNRGGELAALVEREQWLRTQLDELQFSDIAGPGASVLVPPYVEASAVSPKPLINTAAGALAAAIAAVFAVAFLARRMTRA